MMRLDVVKKKMRLDLVLRERRGYMLRLMSKEKLLTVRLAPEVHRDYKVAAHLKGASMSSLVHMFVVRTIKEEKQDNPRAFEHRSEDRPVITAKIKRPRNKERRA